MSDVDGDAPAPARPEQAPTEPSTRLVYGGRYAVEAELGQGGMGRVYRARDLKLQRVVALKVLPAGPHTDVQRLRFEQEARAASALNHPNVVAVHDVGEQDGEPFIVSELLEGETLRVRLSRGPLDGKNALELAGQLAKGLAAAHARGIVHRDIKPENVFITAGDTLKILDFGIARLPAGSEVRTETGAVMGTPQYMSPEQVRGDRADARSDVFSFGSVAFELLAGRGPFDRPTTVETGFAILHEAPETLPPGAPAKLVRVIARCLHRDPALRYPDAGALLHDLTEEIARPRRGQRLARFASAVIVAAVAVAVWAPWSRPAPADAPSVAVLPFADLSPGKDQEYFSDGIAEEILGQLAHVPGLRVVGRTSSFSFKGKSAALGEIGRALNVGAVLEGSVGRDGGRVRVTARLTNAATGYELWSEKYDRELSGIFATQDEIARAVVRALRLKLVPAVAAERGSVNPEAYNEYLLGRRFLGTGSRDDVPRAQAALERAVALDPKFAAAWAALANAAYEHIAFAIVPGTDETVRRRALEAADKAVELAPGLGYAWAMRANVRFATMTFDWEGITSDLDRALSLDPADAEVLRIRSRVFAALGQRDRALAEAERAAALDPLSSAAWTQVGSLRGDVVAAERACKRALEISPDLRRARGCLFHLFLLQGRPADALEITEYPVQRAMALHSLGRDAEARQILENQPPDAHWQGASGLAAAWAWLGDRERAFFWLDHAFEVKDPGLVVNVKRSEFLRSIRSDPRYAALLRKMKLPVD